MKEQVQQQNVLCESMKFYENLSRKYFCRATTTDSNLDEYSNDSTTASNQTEKSSSQSIVSLVILLIIAGGIICLCKYKCQTKSEESGETRSSYESENSVTSDNDD